MTELVLVSDLHGNAPALKAVCDAEGTDSTLVVLGDIHGLNAFPERTTKLVQTYGDYVIAGNHDKAIFEYNEGHVVNEHLADFEVSYTREQLSDEQIAWMQALPYMGVEQFGNHRVAYAHAAPASNLASGYERNNPGIRKHSLPHMASIYASDYDWVFTGHTHEQYDHDCRKWDHDIYFVNPGSLGYDETYSVVDLDTREVTHKRVDTEVDYVSHIDARTPARAPSAAAWR